ncbi:hypothetical protein E2C01_098924 [Portunus trituberculatus]|uniref:Uncharacterized protein n=1 Tax=Portunus trituberculatus TaxID=210409 RepID=A0A5B7K9H3_PORTR|nr:hypothetical protein [Portunus trituberculatus]
MAGRASGEGAVVIRGGWREAWRGGGGEPPAHDTQQVEQRPGPPLVAGGGGQLGGRAGVLGGGVGGWVAVGVSHVAALLHVLRQLQVWQARLVVQAVPVHL